MKIERAEPLAVNIYRIRKADCLEESEKDAIALHGPHAIFLWTLKYDFTISSETMINHLGQELKLMSGVSIHPFGEKKNAQIYIG